MMHNHFIRENRNKWKNTNNVIQFLKSLFFTHKTLIYPNERQFLLQ